MHEDSDEYISQLVGRFLRNAYPMLKLKPAGGDKSVLEKVLIEEIDAQRAHLMKFLIAALEDDDGRVRNAAEKGLNVGGTAMHVDEYNDKFDALAEMIAELESEFPEDKRKHVEQARHTIERQRGLGPFFPPLPGKIVFVT